MRIHFLVLVCLFSLRLWAEPLLTADFEHDPLRAGWAAYSALGGEGIVRWVSPGADGAGYALEVAGGVAQSPLFAVDEGQRYRIRFDAKGEGPAQWAVYFYDSHGWLLAYDHYAGIGPSATWTTQEFNFTTKYPGVRAVLALRSDGPALRVDNLRIDPVDAAKSDELVVKLEASLPPMTVPPAQGTLPRSIAKLEAGGPFRIVILGDSIGNDLSNAPLDILLERAFPKARVELRFTGRGGTGYETFARNVYDVITRHKPDLVILLSITNRLNTNMGGALQSIIDATRRGVPQAEILLVTPHVDVFSPNNFSGDAQRQVLRFTARNNDLPLVDLLQAWQDYLHATNHEQPWLLRDVIHMNERGRLLSAKAVLAAFGVRDRGMIPVNHQVSVPELNNSSGAPLP
jgi:lysophospholipase L1-like esterase